MDYNKIVFRIKLNNKLGLFFIGATVGNIALYNIPMALTTTALYSIGKLYEKYLVNSTKNSEQFRTLRECYVDVFNEICDLKEDLELESVEEIFAYFTFLLRNNYLSYNRSSEGYHTDYIFEELSILSELTLNNHGVCRNITAMLSDLYNEYSLDASPHPGYLDNNEIVIEVKGEGILSKKELKIVKQSPKNEEEAQKIFDILIKKSERIIKQRQKEEEKRKKIGNHLITKVNDENYTYYLDPTHSQIYIPTHEEGVLISNIESTFTTTEEAIKHYKKMYGFYVDETKGTKNIREMIEKLNRAEVFLMENQKAFDKFEKKTEEPLKYAEEAYTDITKVLR